MEAEILERPPQSGDYEEHIFSKSGNTLWVKFYDDDYIEWAGVFSKSEWSSFNTVLSIPNEKLVLVVAGGQGYFVDPNKREIVSTTDWDSINNITFNEATGFLVATDGLRLALFKGPQLQWSGERISADGISFTKQSGPVISGVLNDLSPEGCKFTFNANTLEFNTSWVLAENWG